MIGGWCPGEQTILRIDERSGGFVALGIAKATGEPVAVTCTSGTAVANLMFELACVAAQSCVRRKRRVSL